MEIVSPFKDYYDIALRQGQSSRIRFLRKSEFYGHNGNKDDAVKAREFMYAGMPGIVSTSAKKGANITLKPFRVAFCGKLYNGISARYWDTPTVWDGDSPVRSEFLYKGEHLDKFVTETGFLPEESTKPTMTSKRWATAFPGLQTFLDAPPAGLHHGFFVANGEPITLAERHQYSLGITVNPCLSEIAFYKILDPWQAFQELEMFLGGIAAPENRPPVVIADKDRIAQHGFDKMSFRKAPTKRA